MLAVNFDALLPLPFKLNCELKYGVALGISSLPSASSKFQ
jgi:hypothetical protein